MTGRDFSSELFGVQTKDPFDAALQQEGVSGMLADVARSIYQQESSGGRNTQTSNAGAVGHMQVIPATFNSFADKGWDISNPEQNIRAGLRYIKHLAQKANNDPRLIAVGYYGGEGAIPKAQQGIAVRDPRNPNAPDTLQYGEQVASRVPQQPTQQPGRDMSAELFGAVETPSRPTQSFPANIGPSSMKQSLQEAIAADAWPSGAEFVAGMGTALDNAALRLKQIFSNLTPEEKNRALMNREITGTGAGLAGNVTGSLMALGPFTGAAIGALAPQAARVLPKAVAPTVAPTVAAGAVNAAIAPTTMPLVGDETAAGNAAIGFASGALGDLGARAAARVVRPIIQSDAVKTLLRSGVVPTPGQAAGKNSIAGRMEQALQSEPLLGQVIGGGRSRAASEFNRAAINQGIPQGQQNVSQIGRIGIDEMRHAADRNFSRILSGKEVIPDEELAASFIAAKQSGQIPLSERGEQIFDSVIKRNVWDRIPFRNARTPVGGNQAAVPGTPGATAGGSVPYMPADKMKAEIIGDLGKVARDFLRSQSAEERAVGQALMGARDNAQKWLIQKAGLNASEMAIADAAYTAQKAVEGAGRAAMANEKQFTPLQLLRNSVPRSASERLAVAGQEVLPGTLPNSGTADRVLFSDLIRNPTHSIPGLLASIPASVMYSRAGSRYMLGDLMPRTQNTLSELLRSASPYTPLVGQNTLINLLGQ